ncbi:MAG: DinB family protein [Sphingobacteriales bacterium]|nr:DinB family protein [Sphingobacteriales bacterium]
MKKIISFTMLCFLLAGSFLSTRVSAQAYTNDDLKTIMSNDWVRAKTYTADYLNTMPADKYSFKATDSVRSFAQQMLHLATANVFLMATATDQQPLPWASFDLEKRTTAQTKDSVMYYVTASYDYCLNGVKNSDPTKWKDKVTLFGFETTKYGLLQKVFEHQTHHRGQTTIYIRLTGIKPPEERLF